MSSSSSSSSLSKILMVAGVALVAGQHEHEEHGHGHMHADGTMHYGDHGDGHDEAGFDNPQFDPDYVLTNDDFLKMDAETFWNEALPKLDHSKLDDIISQLDKDHLQKMLSSMPGMDGMDHDDGYGDFGGDDFGGDEVDEDAENDPSFDEEI